MGNEDFHGCDGFLQLIHRSLDGELDRGEDRVLHDHLAQCAHCAGLLVQYRRLKDFSRPVTVEPPPTLRPRLMEALRAESAALRSESAALQNGAVLENVLFLFRRAAVAALVFVAISATLFFSQTGTLQADDKPIHYEDLFSIGAPEEALEALIHTTTQKDALRRFCDSRFPNEEGE